MAPARMMQFVDQHVKSCPICQSDLLLPDEVEKIREFILPESKILKAARPLDDSSTPEISPDDEEVLEKSDTFEGDGDLDEDDIEVDDDLNEEEII